MKCTPQNTIVDCVGRRGDPGQAERVADVVGDVLDLGQLVVVGEDDGVALAGQLAHLPAQSAGRSVTVALSVGTASATRHDPCQRTSVAP